MRCWVLDTWVKPVDANVTVLSALSRVHQSALTYLGSPTAVFTSTPLTTLPLSKELVTWITSRLFPINPITATQRAVRPWVNAVVAVSGTYAALAGPLMHDKAAVLAAMKKNYAKTVPTTAFNHHTGPIPSNEATIRGRLNGLFKCKRCDTLQYFSWNGRDPDVQSVACWNCEMEDKMERV